MIRLLPVLAAALCAGIAVVAFLHIGFYIVYGVTWIAAFLLVVLRRRRRVFLIVLVCCFFALGADLWSASCLRPAVQPSGNLAFRSGFTCAVRGEVCSVPVIQYGHTLFRMHAHAFSCDEQTYPAPYPMMVNLSAEMPLEYGEEVVARGTIRRAYADSRKGQTHSYPDGAQRYLRMSVAAPAYIERLGINRPVSLMRLALRMRRHLEFIVLKYMQGVPARIMAGMLLGSGALIPPLVYDAMIKTGTVHILVISGSHVAIVVVVIVFMLRLMHVPRRFRFALAVPILIFYCFLTGASAPVVRATVMASMFLAAYPLRRNQDVHNAWALAACVILSASPESLFNLGFQLSFVCVLSILYIYPFLAQWTGIKQLKITCLRWVGEGFLVSCAVWVGTVGLIAYSCRMISPVTILANVVIVPLSSLITLCGFTLLLAAAVCPAAIPHCARVCEVLVIALLKVNALFLKIPWAYFTW